MNYEQLFVGAVAVALGVLSIAAAIGNRDGYYRFRKVRWMEATGGRWVARVLYAVLGVLLIVLGLAIALGFGPNKSGA